jgi:hypothetical protein
MSGKLISVINQELDTAREVMKPRRETGMLTSATVKEIRFYHNSKTRHNGCIMHLEGGETVYKEFKEGDWLNILATFTRVKEVVVWYDQAKNVQQFVLNHIY